MTEQEKQLTDQDTTQEEVQDQEVESPEQQAQEQEKPEVVAKESPVAQNMRALREEKERLQKQNEEYLRRLWELEKQKEAQQAVPEEKYTEPGPDELVEWKQVRRELKKRDDELLRYRQQMEASSVETRIKAQYADFDKIVSSDNISLLNTMEPELANSIASNPDMYSKAVAAYKAIKKLALPKDEYTEEKDRILRNTAKPRPSNSTASQSSDSPLTKANAFGKGLTEEQKRAYWKEMQEITGR